MHVDLFLELATPPVDGRPRDLSGVIEDTIALARAAEAAGVDALWLAEHHFLGDYSNASCPDLIAAALARETRTIKLGFAIIPLPIHDPVRVAERLATLDLMSGGRIMWGAGRGVTATELAGFGVAPGEARARMTENLARLRAMLRTGRFERAGRSYELRPAPAPRLDQAWLACVSPESF